jgi:hypothetical protein
MTESEWLICTGPWPMKVFVSGKASDRKLRLFGAFCHRIWHLLIDERSRRAVEVAERYAAGLATEEELDTASDAAWAVWDADVEQAGLGEPPPPCLASQAAFAVAIPCGWWGAAPAYVEPDFIACQATRNATAEGMAQCVLLRDIFGNPFRPIRLDIDCRMPSVVALAQAAYDNRILPAGTLDPARLAVLSDALEEAGCHDTEILGHCRQAGPHVRGCWVVDAVLGRS